MNYYKVKTHCSYNSHHSPEEYGSWSEHTDTEFRGISPVPEEDYYDGISTFDLITGVKYYLVYVKYSSGDSFGISTGNIQYVELFESKELAEKCKESYVSQYEAKKKADNYNYIFTFIDGTGEEVKHYAGYAFDYFGGFDSIDIEELECE